MKITKNLNIIILANGQSKRMLYNKSLFFIKKKTLIEHIKIFFKKNIKIYVNSNIKIYNNIPDLIKNIGPISALYTVIKYFKKKTYYYFQ